MELNRNNTVDVLIAGAGPAGLMMACQLARHNVSFRIIDQKSSPAIHSGALIIHARTLEILHQMGFAEKALKAGFIAKTIHLQFSPYKKLSLDISQFGKGSTQFPYLLMLEQWHTETLLIDFLLDLGHSVETNSPLLAFTQGKEMVTSEILRPDGIIELISSRFLIGADGSNSLVRKQLNIPFPGKTQKSRLFITDCEAPLLPSTSEIFFSFAPDFTSGFFPLPDNRWRVDGLIPHIQQKEVGFEDVRNFFGSQIHSGIELTHPRWFSVFRSHSRCADSFRLNNCFLIGDAAHVHSPVGAQGMNTGLQDAHNLAWKLALFLRGKASVNLLDTYEQERRLLALHIIRYTDWAYSLLTTNSFLIRFLRLKLVPLLLPMIMSGVKRNSWIRSSVFSSISGIGIKYKRSFLSDSSRKFSDRSPKPGERFPYLMDETVGGNPVNLFDGLISSTFQLFIFGRQLLLLPEPFQVVLNRYREVISVIQIAKEAGTEPIFKKLGLINEGCYLVRPDHFIAWRSDEFNAINLSSYLQKFMK